MKRCSICGGEISPGAKFCTACGRRLEENETEPKDTYGYVPIVKESKLSVFRMKPALGLLALIIFAVFITFVNLSGGGYKSVVKKYFEALENDKPQLMLSVVSDDWKTFAKEGWSCDETDLIDLMEDTIDDYQRSWSECGDKVKINYKIEKVHRANKAELNELRDDLYDLYGYYLRNWSKNKITDAVLLDIRYSVKGNGTTQNRTLSHFLLIKENGKWRCSRGYLEGSWY